MRRSIITACERAIIEAGFRTVDIVATLVGELLYASFAEAVVERYDIAWRALDVACSSDDQEYGK